MDVEYTRIYDRGKIVVNTGCSFIGQFVRLLGGGRGWSKGEDRGIVILARCKFLFISEHENLV